MSYQTAKDAIDLYIKQNNVGAITGPVLNDILTIMMQEIPAGRPGDKGEKGDDGEQGLRGNIGPEGLDAIQAWLVRNPGKTLDDYIEAIRGLKGDEGKDAITAWLDRNPGKTITDYIEAIRGIQGIPGIPGPPGPSDSTRPSFTVSNSVPTNIQGTDNDSWMRVISPKEAVLYKRVNAQWEIVYEFGNIDFDTLPVIRPGYDNTYYVSAEGDDDTAIINSPKQPYKNIKTATTLAAADFAAGLKPFVYVYTGVYNEHHITRHGVDMYFERKAIVYGDGTNAATDGPPGWAWSDGPVISDWQDPFAIFNIYGEGEFYCKVGHWASDRVGVNCFKTGTKITVEAAVIDGFDMWGGGFMELNLKNTQILFHFGQKSNKAYRMERCKFMSGFAFGGYQGADNLIEMLDCEFVLPVDGEQYNNVYDIDGNLAFTISNAQYTPTNISALTHEQVNNLQFNTSSLNSLLGAIAYMENQNGNGNSFDNCKIRIINPIIKIRRNKCAGIRVQCSYNNPGLSIAIHNPTIFDETVEKQTTGYVIGKLPAVTPTPEFGIEGPLANVTMLEWVPTTMVKPPFTFKTQISELYIPVNTYYQAKFNTGVIVADIQYIKGRWVIADTLHPLISSVQYAVSIDGGTTWVNYATVGDINTWSQNNTTSSTDWEVKRVPVPNTANGTGSAAIKVTLTPLV